MAGKDSKALLQGAADIYITDTVENGGVEPTSAHFSGPAPTSWTHLGYTAGGTEISFAREYSDIMVDQTTLPMHGVVTGDSLGVTTNLAQFDLEKIQVALSGGTIVTGTGFESYEPEEPLAGSFVGVNYKMLIIAGYAPRTSAGPAQKGFVVIRKVLSVEGTKIAWKKDDQTVLEVSFKGYALDNYKPFKLLNQKAA